MHVGWGRARTRIHDGLRPSKASRELSPLPEPKDRLMKDGRRKPVALEHLGDKSEPEAWREAGLPSVCRVSPQQPRQDRGRTTPPGNQLPALWGLPHLSRSAGAHVRAHRHDGSERSTLSLTPTAPVTLSPALLNLSVLLQKSARTTVSCHLLRRSHLYTLSPCSLTL